MKPFAALLPLALIMGVTFISAVAFSSPAFPTLDRDQHDRLRYKLETLFNEQDLLIRNQRVDHSDVAHQLHDFETLKVFQRIPFKPEIQGLRQSLKQSSNDHGLKLIDFKLRPKGRGIPVKPLPESLYTDDPVFRLSDDQIADEIPFSVVVQGAPSAVLSWMEAWPEEQMRLTEPEGKSIPGSIRNLGNSHWQVQAHAFRFRPIRFPSLMPRDPVALLHKEGIVKPEQLAKQDPLLWSFVTRILEISPQARPLYRGREEMLLNSAQMSFFVAKAVPRLKGRSMAKSH
jgi:hypothetical protein